MTARQNEKPVRLSRAIFPDEAARFFVGRTGEPYRPSNGTEGDVFENVWCSGCRRQTLPDGNGCLIQLRAWACDLGDENYPPEWIYGADGQPCCTAFSDKHAPRPVYHCKATGDLFGAPPTIKPRPNPADDATGGGA
ncbi:hypothetical protein [Methylobacterium sp. WL8]|uniref:hypothetical protein n=1 Tax=Methylobacterium sp. WL8 TaxID=2603899 RepID=UPI0011C7CD16|nr:hypothetical protein [Methylobacterium sp. WL8]TXN80621.1 hypothetical protein FV234_16485 [Methylobacterium sp. WL8]